MLSNLRRNREKRDALLAQRDLQILEARLAGVPVTHIAEAVGLDRTQVHRIIRDAGFNESMRITLEGDVVLTKAHSLPSGRLRARLRHPAGPLEGDTFEARNVVWRIVRVEMLGDDEFQIEAEPMLGVN